MIRFIESPLKGHFTGEVSPFSDQRGLFEKLFCKKEFNDAGFNFVISQINHSISKKRGTLRGMHFQVPPFDEAKIIKCIKGSVYDIAIDLRRDSETFLNWIAIEITEHNQKIVIIPKGFAHGFQTLTENSELLYFHTGYYNPGKESAINYLDPLIKIALPLEVCEISQRDKSHPFIKDPLKDIPYFSY